MRSDGSGDRAAIARQSARAHKTAQVLLREFILIMQTALRSCTEHVGVVDPDVHDRATALWANAFAHNEHKHCSCCNMAGCVQNASLQVAGPRLPENYLDIPHTRRAMILHKELTTRFMFGFLGNDYSDFEVARDHAKVYWMAPGGGVAPRGRSDLHSAKHTGAVETTDCGQWATATGTPREVLRVLDLHLRFLLLRRQVTLHAQSVLIVDHGDVLMRLFVCAVLRRRLLNNMTHVVQRVWEYAFGPFALADLPRHKRRKPHRKVNQATYTVAKTRVHPGLYSQLWSQGEFDFFPDPGRSVEPDLPALLRDDLAHWKRRREFDFPSVLIRF